MKTTTAHNTSAAVTERTCPECSSSDYGEFLCLRQDDFVSVNPTYNPAEVSAMGFGSEDVFKIVRCAHCRFIYARTMLSDNLTKYLYERVIDSEQSKIKIYTPTKMLGLLKTWTDLFTLQVQGSQKKINIKVLDYGCGWGDFISVASAPGVNCMGFETDSRKATFVREMGTKVVEAEEDINAAAPFDIIYCHHVLEHLPDPEAAVNKFNTWLQPGGYGWVAVPHCGEYFISDMRQRLSRGEPLAKEVNPWEHLNYFTPHSFSAMLERNGFVVVSPEADNRVPKKRSQNRGIIKSLIKKTIQPERQHETVPASTAIYIRKKQK